MHLVTCATSGHTTKMAVTLFNSRLPKTPCCTQTSWLYVLCFIEPELLPIEVLHCRNRDFRPFLLLWPWPWHDDLHIHIWSVSPRDIPDVQKKTSYIKAFESYHITDTYTYIHKDNIHTYIHMPRSNQSYLHLPLRHEISTLSHTLE